MKTGTLLFTFLLLLIQAAGIAQENRQASRDMGKDKTPGKEVTRVDASDDKEGLMGEVAVKEGDSLKYHTLYQDYSHLAVAIADSKLEVADRLATLTRLADAYFAKKPKAIKLPINLLKTDGSQMTDQEMEQFMVRLIKTPKLNATAKSATMSTREIQCITEYYQYAWQNHPLSQVFPHLVIVADIPLLQSIYPETVCNAGDIWLQMAANQLGN